MEDRREIRTPRRTINSMAKKVTLNVESHVATLAQEAADRDHGGNLSALVNRALKEHLYRDMGRRRAEWLAAHDDAEREGQVPADEAEERHYISDRDHAGTPGRRGAA